MNKIWFALFDGRQEGPYAVEDLKKDSRIHPDIFVWKEGFQTWKRIRDVPELACLFKEDRPPGEDDEEESEKQRQISAAQQELALELGGPPGFFWIILALFIIAYFLGQLFWK